MEARWQQSQCGRSNPKELQEGWESPVEKCTPPTQSHVPAGGEDNMVASGVLSISEEQLSQHPMVIQMMRRLEALEKR